jgi:hypothetical protein
VTASVRPYTPWKDSGKCARCRGTLAAGQPCEVVTADGYVEHRHADCQPSGNGGALADRLMSDIRASKPPAKPHPTNRKVQGT